MPESQNQKTTLTTLQVLYEDNHLIIINKRPGDLVQGDKTGDRPLSDLVKSFIKQKYNKPGEAFLGVIHRLDRPTSGIVCFAKTSKALSRMNAIFAKNEAKKTYWALTQACPDPTEGELVHWLKRNPKQNKSYAYQEEIPQSKMAMLSYRLIKTLERYSLLEIDLKTGRHHQIRAQLAVMGCFIKGDLKYGAPRSNTDGSIHLHARSLAFTHPVKKEPLQILAPPPKEALWNACL